MYPWFWNALAGLRLLNFPQSESLRRNHGYLRVGVVYIYDGLRMGIQYWLDGRKNTWISPWPVFFNLGDADTIPGGKAKEDCNAVDRYEKSD